MPCEICSSVSGKTVLKIEPRAYEKGGLFRDRMIPEIPQRARIDIEKITKTNLQMVYLDKPWLRKIHLTKENDAVIWKYEDFEVPIYIKEDGFFVKEEDYDKYPLKVLRQRAYLCFSVLRRAKMIKYV